MVIYPVEKKKTSFIAALVFITLFGIYNIKKLYYILLNKRVIL